MLKTTELALSSLKDLPNLHEVEVSPKELSSEYWTPSEENEYKVGVIIEVRHENYTNEDTGETIVLPCVVMIAQNKDKSYSTVRNGSKRLVATIEGAITSGDIEYGKTPVKVTYIGNQKNKTNQFKSDRWSVKPLILK